MIPAAVRRQLTDEDYARLESLLFARADRLDPQQVTLDDGHWGDQRAED